MIGSCRGAGLGGRGCSVKAACHRGGRYQPAELCQPQHGRREEDPQEGGQEAPHQEELRRRCAIPGSSCIHLVKDRLQQGAPAVCLLGSCCNCRPIPFLDNVSSLQTCTPGLSFVAFRDEGMHCRTAALQYVNQAAPAYLRAILRKLSRLPLPCTLITLLQKLCKSLLFSAVLIQLV